MLHDTHAHLDILLEKLGYVTYEEATHRGNFAIAQTLKDWQEELNNLLVNHEFTIQPTISTDNFLLVQQMFGNNPKVFFLLGSHPEIIDATFDVEEYLSIQRGILAQQNFPRFVGIGECGLDYYYTQEPRILKKQQQLFEAQIQLAIELNLPLIIHCREAFADTFALLRKYPGIHGKFLFHCFTGNTKDLEETIKLGGMVAYGGVITFKNAQTIQDTVPQCPSEHFVLETDLPFLAPVPHRGKTCLPAYISHTAEKIAEMRQQTLVTIWQHSRANTLRLFQLPI
jgi:TatD DNase family protein